MSVICLMLFIAIGMSSTGIGMKKSLENTIEIQTPFDMSMYIEVNEEKDNIEINEYLNEHEINLSDYTNEIIKYNLYDNNIAFKEMFKNTNDTFLRKQLKVTRDFNVPIMKLSDYNKLMKVQNKKEIDLKEHEVVLLTDMSSMEDAIKDFINNNDFIEINNKKIKVNKNYEFQAIETLPMAMNFITLIVDDNQVDNMQVYKKYVSFNYKGDKLETEERILNQINKVEDTNPEAKEVKISAMTRLICFDNNMAIANIYLFVGIYIGIVFLISSATVLALTQLSGATESIERYKVLKKLGVSTEMINKSIFVQVLLYFTLPIGLSLVHSIYGIKVANEFIKVFGNYDMVKNNTVSIGVILAVYAVYFIATYNSYKGIVNSNQR